MVRESMVLAFARRSLVVWNGQTVGAGPAHAHRQGDCDGLPRPICHSTFESLIAG